MPDLPGIREVSTYRPSYVDQLSEMAKGLNISGKSAEVTKAVSELLATNSSVRVTNASQVTMNKEVGTVNGATGIPSLDSPDSELVKKANVERMLLKLKLEGDVNQEQVAKTGVESSKDRILKNKEEIRAKMKSSLDKMDRASHMSFFQKLVKWVGGAAALALAISACVATGGVAVGPVIAATLTLGSCLADEFGATEALTDVIAGGLEALGVDKDVAKMAATIGLAVVITGASLIAGGVGSAYATSEKVAEGLAKTTTSILGDISQGLQVAGLLNGGISTGLNYDASISQARLEKDQAIFVHLRKILDDNQEKLQAILELIQEDIGKLCDLLEAKEESLDTITKSFVNMA